MKRAFSAYDHSLGQLFDDYQQNPGNAELLHQLCLGLNLRGFHQSCIEMARTGLTIHAFHPNIYLEMLIAKNLTEGEDLPSLETELATLVQDRPGDLGHLRNFALYHFYLEDDRGAEKLLTEILDQFETDQIDPYTYEVLAQLYLSLGHLNDCLEYCDLGLAKQGSCARLVRIRGLCLLEMGNTQAGRACFEQALDLEPSFLWACHDLGNLMFEQDDLCSAIAYFGRAQAINPLDPSNYFLPAEAFAERDAYRIATSEIEKLILTNPPTAVLGEAHSVQGLLFLEQGDLENAQKALEEAMKIIPTSPAPYHIMGLLAQRTSIPGNPMSWFDQALECDPEHIDTWLAKGSLLISNNQLEDAEMCFQNAVDLDPESADGYVGLSKVASKRGLAKNQLMYLKTAVQLAGADPNTQGLLAEAFIANHSYSEALDVLHRALKSDPTHFDVLKHLLTILTKGDITPSKNLKSSLMKIVSAFPTTYAHLTDHLPLAAAIRQKLESPLAT